LKHTKPITIPSGFATMDPREVKPHPTNIKKHPQEQIDAIVQAILLLKVWKDPLGLTKDGTCYFGNGRLLAALKLQEMGLLDVIPYVPIDHLSKKERNALMILDNKIADMATYDKANMAVVLQQTEGFDFTEFHLDLDAYNPIEGQQDEIPDPRPSTNIVPGDMFELGQHRILCGDSTKPEDVAKLLDAKTVDQMLTDPPYGVDYSSKNKYLNKVMPAKRLEIPIQNDAIEDYLAFYTAFLIATPFSDYNTIYVFQGGIHTHRS